MGNSKNTFPNDEIWFFGVKETTILERVNMVALWADNLHDTNLPGVNVSLVE